MRRCVRTFCISHEPPSAELVDRLGSVAWSMQVLSGSDPKKHVLTTKYGICDTGQLEVSLSLEVEEEE